MAQAPMEALRRLTRELHPVVEQRVLAFADVIADDLEFGTGTSTLYNVPSTFEAVRVLVRYEQSGQVSDRHSELIDDYLAFIRSHNVIPE